MNTREVEIIGGGLAGLSLGLALRHADVPVRVLEAGQYPRHRVCGEFITGLAPATVTALHLAPILGDALQHAQLAWFRDGRLLRRDALPAPALGLSRFALDARLAHAFVAAGGPLVTGQRATQLAPQVGRVFAHGRRRTRSRWLGLKVHATDLALAADLELHLGRHGYVGLCPVENNRVNVCGLFRVQPGLSLERSDALLVYLRACGFVPLAQRLEGANIDPASCSAVAGLSFAPARPRSGVLALGDALAMIPPFTGNGMAIAFQSAEQSLAPLVAWARGKFTWPQAVAAANQRLRRAFRRRFRSAAALHPFLLRAAPQRLLTVASRSSLLPMRLLYAALH
jgi:flavin-dependent dehydrogenase